MEQAVKQSLAEVIGGFCLPAYDEIPDVGLFLEQVTQYLCDHFKPLSSFSVTSSMVSNYVKKNLIANPVKKQYSREQIACLFFIVAAKTVLTLDDIQLLIRLQQMTYPVQQAYDYFRQELSNVLSYVFEVKDSLDVVGSENTQEKVILRNTIMAVAHKVYLDQCLAVTRQLEIKQENPTDSAQWG